MKLKVGALYVPRTKEYLDTDRFVFHTVKITRIDTTEISFKAVKALPGKTLLDGDSGTMSMAKFDRRFKPITDSMDNYIAHNYKNKLVRR